jgi:drug/metabolite transporter (DMT)-like permease
MVRGSSTLPIILALGTVYLVWGSTYLAISYVVETMPPFVGAGTRFLAAGAVLVAFLLAQHRWRRARGAPSTLAAPRLVEWRTAAIVGTLLLLGGNGMVMVAEQSVPTGIAAVIIATVPIWMSSADALLSRRFPGWLAIGGLLVGLIGVAILLLPSDGIDAVDPIGIGILMIAALAWAAGSVYARRGPLPRNELLGTGMEQLAGGASLFLVAAAVGEFGRLDIAAVSTASWLGLGYLIVFGSLVAFTAYVWLLNHAPVTTVATYAYVNPVVAVVLGLLFRGETLTLRTILAAALIIGAVVAMVSGRPRDVEEQGPSPEVASLNPRDEAAGANRWRSI